MKYNLIVIDPPWPTNKITRNKRPNQTNIDYPVMSIDDINNMNISLLSDDKSFVFLWSIQRFLCDSFSILNHWGFNYLATMVWEKTYGRSNGMPLFGFRFNAEFILIGYKGKIELWPKRPLIPLVFQAENIKHSAKPDKFYEMITPLGTKRIDIFARKIRDGWDSIGNEIDGLDITESINIKSKV